MPLNFPDTPAVNDTFTSNGRTWKYTGTAWDLVPITHTHGMADLVDFNIGTPATNDMMVFNGTKWANSATIPQASVSGLTTSLSGKSNTGHTHTVSEVTPTTAIHNSVSYLGTDWFYANSLILVDYATQVDCYLAVYPSQNLPVGTRYDFVQTGAGQLYFRTGGNISTIISVDNKVKTSKKGSAATAIYAGGSTYIVVGDLTA